MTYKYPRIVKPKRVRRTNRLQTIKPSENLTGLIQGLNASADEERVAKALKARGLKFMFQQRLTVATQFEKKDVDFLVLTIPRPTPLEVDGFIGHYTSSQQAADRLRETLINSEKTGWSQMKRITFRHTTDQEATNQEIRRLFANAAGV